MKTLRWNRGALAVNLIAGGLFLAVFTAAQGGPPKNEPVIPIEGLDPVLLVQGKEVQGKESIAVVRGKFKYIFATQESKAAFEKDPTQYEVGEYCQTMGAPTTGNPDLHAEYKGKIYLFGSDGCIRAFKAAPEDFIEPVQAPWKVTSAEAARGRALLDQAAAAMGGTHGLAAVTSFREVRNQKMKNRDGSEFAASMEILRAATDGLRQVDMRPFGKITTVFAGAEGFVHFERPGTNDVRPLPADAREMMEKTLLRDPFFLLQARQRPDFRAAATGAGKVGESAVEWVQAETFGQRFTLGIEPASGKVLSLALITRGPTGKYGNYQLQFGEYRSDSGLNFPYRADVQFNGEPQPRYSYTVSEIEVNKPVDRAIFEKPKSNR